MIREDNKMSEKKRKFTVIDVIIIIVVIAALAFGAKKLLPSILHPSDMERITFTIMLAQQDEAFAEAIKAGDKVTISLTEKDGGIVREVRSEPATAIAFNSIDGTYANEIIEGKTDVYVTVEADVAANDLALKAGGTAIKVGSEIPLRGKGYASMGYIIEIND